MRLMSSLLFDVSPVDPVTYAAITACVVVTAYLACYLPSRRAATVDPVDTLRAEYESTTHKSVWYATHTRMPTNLAIDDSLIEEARTLGRRQDKEGRGDGCARRVHPPPQAAGSNQALRDRRF